MAKKAEKYHVAQPGQMNLYVAVTLCGQTVSRQRIVGPHRGEFYTKTSNGYPTVDPSKVCGNCKRIAGIKE